MQDRDVQNTLSWSAGDELALDAWSKDVISRFVKHSGPPGGRVRRMIVFPRWGASIFVRKSREIGFSNTVRLSIAVVSARLGARR